MKNIAILAVAGAALIAALPSKDDDKDQGIKSFNNDMTPGTLIEVKSFPSGQLGKEQMWYLIDTDNNPSTAEYTGCLWHLYTSDEILEAYNDKQAKPTMSLAQWNKKLNQLRKAPVKTRE